MSQQQIPEAVSQSSKPTSSSTIIPAILLIAVSSAAMLAPWPDWDNGASMFSRLSIVSHFNWLKYGLGEFSGNVETYGILREGVVMFKRERIHGRHAPILTLLRSAGAEAYGSGWWQANWWPSPIWTSGGISNRQRSVAFQQRVLNTQPVGGFIGLGRSPDRMIRSR